MLDNSTLLNENELSCEERLKLEIDRHRFTYEELISIVGVEPNDFTTIKDELKTIKENLNKLSIKFEKCKSECAEK